MIFTPLVFISLCYDIGNVAYSIFSPLGFSDITKIRRATGPGATMVLLSKWGRFG
jgi:hypothetical protein